MRPRSQHQINNFFRVRARKNTNLEMKQSTVQMMMHFVVRIFFRGKCSYYYYYFPFFIAAFKAAESAPLCTVLLCVKMGRFSTITRPLLKRVLLLTAKCRNVIGWSIFSALARLSMHHDHRSIVKCVALEVISLIMRF